MRDNGIYARHKRRYKVTTDSKHGLPVAENLLARNFTPTAPNQVWTSDITYRLHSTLGYQSLVQFLENWIGEQHQEKLVA